MRSRPARTKTASDKYDRFCGISQPHKIPRSSQAGHALARGQRALPHRTSSFLGVLFALSAGSRYASLQSGPSWPWLTSTSETHMNKDQIKGRIEEAKGKVKEVTGKVVGDEEMEAEGNIQKNIGKVQAGVGDLREDIKKAF